MNLTASARNDGSVDLTGKQGTTWKIGVQLFQNPERTTPLPLAGYSVRSHVKANIGDATPVAMFTCSVTDETTGMIQQAMPASETSAIPHTEFKGRAVPYYYDVEIYKGSPEEVTRVLQGKLTLDPEVTK